MSGYLPIRRWDLQPCYFIIGTDRDVPFLADGCRISGNNQTILAAENPRFLTRT